MRDAINKVKSAVARKDIASHLSHYLVKGGMIHASDNRLTAAAPFPFDGEFLVPGPDFEAVAERFGEDTRIEVGKNDVTFRSGRLKATLQTLPTNIVDYRMPQGEWSELPPDFIEALGKVRPFISDNAVHYWALSVCLGKDAIYATNNIVVAAAECRGLNGGGRLLPSWAADYLLSRSEHLETIIIGEGSMTFLWADGSWMKSQLVDSKFPEGAEKLIAEMPAPIFQLTSEWKEAYSTISSMTENIVEIYVDKMVGRTQRGEVETTSTSPVPLDGGVSKWNNKFLDPVIQLAEFWQPDSWPKPSPFVGPGVRGLIVGRQ